MGSALRRAWPGEAGPLPQTLDPGAGSIVSSQAAVDTWRRPSFPLRDPVHRHGAPGGSHLQRADGHVWLPCSLAPLRSVCRVPGPSCLGRHTNAVARALSSAPSRCRRVSSSLLLTADPCRQWVWSCRTGGYPRLHLGQLMAEQSPTLPQIWAGCVVGGPAAHSLSSIDLVL